MFDTIEEADEFNSHCSFCGKLKFTTVPADNNPDDIKYQLVRCDTANCEIHCSWGHNFSIELNMGGPDVVAIASGW